MDYLKVEMRGMFSDVESRVSSNGNKFIRGKFNMKLANQRTGEEYVKTMSISAWGDVADIIEQYPENVEATVVGTLRTSSYDKKCESCGNEYKSFWTEVVINEVVL